MQRPFSVLHELHPLSFYKIFNHNTLFCDDTDDFNFYKYISNLNYYSSNVFEILN